MKIFETITDYSKRARRFRCIGCACIIDEGDFAIVEQATRKRHRAWHLSCAAQFQRDREALLGRGWSPSDMAQRKIDAWKQYEAELEHDRMHVKEDGCALS